VKWAFITGGEVKDSPSVVGGLVYVGNYAGEVFALDAKRGTVRWRRTFGGALGRDRIYSSIAIAKRTSYFATIGGTVAALNSRTGATRWTTSIPGLVYSTPALSNGRLFIGNYRGDVFALDMKTGRRLWTRNIGGSISGSPAVLGSLVYVSSLSGGTTHAFDPKTGATRWKYGAGRYVPGIASPDAIYLSLGSFLYRWSA
jgi:outer membrane protein assembly factor BamB